MNSQKTKTPLVPTTAQGSQNGNKWAILAVVGLGTFLSVLDSSVVNVSLPTITQELRTDITTIQWVILGYLLTITGLLLSFGRLGDILGRRPVYVAGMGIFTAGTVLCGLAPTVEVLIAARVVQGIGSAMVMAISPALTASAFPQSERGKALGINSTLVALGAILGPVLGGLLSDLLDWRWIFFFRVPLGLLATLLAWWVLPKIASLREQKTDLPGGVLLFIWLSALAFGLNQGSKIGWASPTILGLFALAVITFFAFILVERRASQPMLELGVFRIRLFTAASASSILSFMANFAVVFLMPFYLIQALGFSTRDAGLMLIPQPIVMSIVAPISGIISDRIGSRLLSTTGLSITCLTLFSMSFLTAQSTYPEVAIRLALIGLGLGLFNSPNSSALISSLHHSKMGIASGMMATNRNLGMVMGTAISGAVWTGRMAFHAEELARTGLSGRALEVQAFVGGFGDAFIVAAAICSIGVFTSLVRGKPPENHEQQAGS